MGGNKFEDDASLVEIRTGDGAVWLDTCVAAAVSPLLREALRDDASSVVHVPGWTFTIDTYKGTHRLKFCSISQTIMDKYLEDKM